MTITPPFEFIHTWNRVKAVPTSGVSSADDETQRRMNSGGAQAPMLVYHMRLLPIVLLALTAQRATACTAVVAGR